GQFYWMEAQCWYNSENLHDMEYIEDYIYNKIMYLQFNSTLGEFVGYTEHGVKNAERMNKNTADQAARKAQVDTYFKHNVKLYQDLIFDET
ncbi:MHC class II beta chain, partial [Clarias magur]